MSALLGWRGIVVILAVLLLAYVVIAFVRLRRIGRPHAVPGVTERSPVPPPVDLPASDDEIRPSDTRDPRLESYTATMDNYRQDNGADAGRRLYIVEQEVVSLRGQVAALNDALQALATELRQEMARSASEAQTTGHLAPVYGDAMQMALAGHDAATISDCCGIARGEAELVVALAGQSQQAEERGQDDGQGRY